MRIPRVRFTIRRLIIAVAAVAVVIAVTFAIDGARDDAARRECRSNLQLIGLALHNYSSNSGDAFPYGTYVDDRLPPQRRLSWLLAIWPYLEQLFWLIDYGKAWDDPANRVTRARGVEGPPFVVAQVRPLTCPAIREPKAAHMPGWTSYVGIAGLGRDAPTLPKTDPRAGVFGYDRQVNLADIRDGLAATMVVVETGDRGPWTAGGRSTVRGLDPGRPALPGEGRQFGGMHRRGAEVLFCDGSVRFVAETVDPRVFEAASTIAGGEQVGEGL